MHDISLCFAAPPSLISDNTSVTVAVDEQVSLSCETSGIPKPEISWEYFDMVITNNASKLLIGDTSTNETSVKSNLTLIYSEASDSGVYSCVATNIAGSVKMNITLTVNGELGVHNFIMPPWCYSHRGII